MTCPVQGRGAAHIARDNSLSGMRGCWNGEENISPGEDLASGIFSHFSSARIIGP